MEEVDFDHKSRENCIGILYVFLPTISVLSAELTPIQGRHLKFKITAPLSATTLTTIAERELSQFPSV